MLCSNLGDSLVTYGLITHFFLCDQSFPHELRSPLWQRRQPGGLNLAHIPASWIEYRLIQVYSLLVSHGASRATSAGRCTLMNSYCSSVNGGCLWLAWLRSEQGNVRRATEELGELTIVNSVVVSVMLEGSVDASTIDAAGLASQFRSR